MVINDKCNLNPQSFFPCLGGDAECEARQAQASADKCKQVARKARLGDMQTHKLNSIYMYDSRTPSRWRWVSKNLLMKLPKRRERNDTDSYS